MEKYHWLQIPFILAAVNVVMVNATDSVAYWITLPQNFTVFAGDALTLTCEVGNSSGVAIRWFRKDFSTSLSDNLGDIYENLYEVTSTDFGQSNLTIKTASRNDNTTFICSHIRANPQHQRAYVNVIIPFDSAEITTQGHNKFSCDATRGNPGAIRMLWKIDGVEVSSADPWSIETDDGNYTSSSICEIDHGIHRNDVTLTCHIIQSDQVKSMIASFTLKASHAGANRVGAPVIQMPVIAVMVIVATIL
ncbi:uncharacterized protein [Ptychodera flava]|uniref:uncharacterized protein n=1 Tax=Ptychodera flava TaxID=63121 RepID=UPI00396A15F1